MCITILSDNIRENREEFTLTLSSESLTVVVTESTATIMIIDMCKFSLQRVILTLASLSQLQLTLSFGTKAMMGGLKLCTVCHSHIFYADK